MNNQNMLGKKSKSTEADVHSHGGLYSKLPAKCDNNREETEVEMVEKNNLFSSLLFILCTQLKSARRRHI